MAGWLAGIDLHCSQPPRVSAFLSTVSPPPPSSSPPPLLPQPPPLFPLLFPSVSYYHQCRAIPPPSSPRMYTQKQREGEKESNPASQAIPAGSFSLLQFPIALFIMPSSLHWLLSSFTLGPHTELIPVHPPSLPLPASVPFSRIYRLF